jgi:hypothetical protein
LQRLLFLLLLRGTMPSSWSEIMTKVGLAEAIQEAIIQEGYDAADIFGFAFTESSALEAWLTRFQSKCEAFKDLPPAEWISHPVAAKCRILWQQVSKPAPPPAPEAGVSTAAPLPACTKKSTTDRDRMRKEVEAKYASHVFCHDTLPSMGLLQIVKQQCVGKHWEWIPWKRILSEAVSQEARARRAADSHNDLLHLVADSMGVLREERGPDNVQSAYRIQCLLGTRANAFAMCGAYHLGSWTLYNKKFSCADVMSGNWLTSRWRWATTVRRWGFRGDKQGEVDWTHV